MLSEINQTEKDKYCITYMQNLKIYNKLENITKKKQIHRYREQTSLVLTSGEVERGKIGVGEWEIQTIGYNTDSRIYCTT